MLIEIRLWPWVEGEIERKALIETDKIIMIRNPDWSKNIWITEIIMEGMKSPIEAYETLATMKRLSGIINADEYMTEAIGKSHMTSKLEKVNSKTIMEMAK